MTEPTPTPDPTPKPDEGTPDSTFTQADVDRIVKERVKRVQDKYADYDELKTKAEAATGLQTKLDESGADAAKERERADRAEVALEKGLTLSQAKRLVGTTREEFTADADELLADITSQKQNNNVVPNEGKNPPASGGGDEREFVRGLFGATE